MLVDGLLLLVADLDLVRAIPVLEVVHHGRVFCVVIEDLFSGEDVTQFMADGLVGLLREEVEALLHEVTDLLLDELLLLEPLSVVNHL